MAIIILGTAGSLDKRNLITAREAGLEGEYANITPSRVKDTISFTSVSEGGGVHGLI